MEVIYNAIVQDCVYEFSRINVKSHYNISSLRREKGPFRPTWTTNFVVNSLMSCTSWAIHSSVPLMLSSSIITTISSLNLLGQSQLIRKVYNLHSCWVNIGRYSPTRYHLTQQIFQPYKFLYAQLRLGESLDLSAARFLFTYTQNPLSRFEIRQFSKV